MKGTSCLNVSLAIDERESATVRGVFQDPGVLDTHTVTIDWGYDGFPDATFDFAPEPRSQRSIGMRSLPASGTATMAPSSPSK